MKCKLIVLLFVAVRAAAVQAQGTLDQEYDVSTNGNGLLTPGSRADWYDKTLSSNSGAAGVGFAGTSGNWRLPRHLITGVAGHDSVRIRFLFSSNPGGVAVGTLIDDIRIVVPSFRIPNHSQVTTCDSLYRAMASVSSALLTPSTFKRAKRSRSSAARLKAKCLVVMTT